MVFSGDFDKVLAVCIRAYGAVAMGDEVVDVLHVPGAGVRLVACT